MSQLLVTVMILTSFTLAWAASAQATERIPAGTDMGVRISSLPDGRVPGPSRALGSYTARILIGTRVKRRPGGMANEWYARSYSKWSGGPQRLMVLSSRVVEGEPWLKVRLPIRPNRSSGWIPRNRVQLAHSPHYISLNLSRRLVKVYKKGKVVTRFRVVVGKPSTPTPAGLFALYDRVRQSNPRDFVGPWVLPLTAHSRPLRRFDGGPGLVAFHGRAGASFLDPLGSARSHGCIRMNNSKIRHLAKYMAGTAVRIRK